MSVETRVRRRKIKADFLPKLEKQVAKLENDGSIREAKAARWAMAELDKHDNPEPYRAITKLVRYPVDIEEFVNSGEFVGHQDDFSVWPAWRKELRKINPDVVCGEAPIYEVVLGGASGTGKTTIAQLTIAYQIYLLTCFKAPNSPFPSMSGMAPVIFPLFSLKPIITRDIIYAPLRRLITSMPYFLKHSDWDKYRDSGLYMHDNRIHLVPQLAMSESMQAQAVCGAILDEMAFMQVIEKSKQVPGPRGQGGKFDQALLLHRHAVNRRNRSCGTRGISVGCLCVMSNTRYQGDFIDVRLGELDHDPRPNVYSRRLMRQQVNPQDVADIRRGDKIRILVGAPGYSTRVLTDDERESIDYDVGARIVEVPVRYRDQFKDDPDGGLREVCGIATGVITPFIARRESLKEAFDRGARLVQWVDKSNVDLAEDGMPEWNGEDIPSNREDPRFIHVDLSASKDRCGVAVVRIAGGTYVGGEDEKMQELGPHLEVEVAVSIKPRGTHQLDPGDVRSWLMQLGKEHGVNIAGIGYDGYQSHESLQRWIKAGVRARLISLDRNSEAYMEFRRALYQNRVDLAPNDVLYDELLDLEYNSEKDRVDHPPKGSKDIADAVAGACWLAQNSRTVRAWAGYVDERGQRIRVRNVRQRRKGGEGRRPGYSRGIIRSR